MDPDTRKALSIIARLMDEGWDKDRLAGGLSAEEAVGYMILNRVGSHVHPDLNAKRVSATLVSLVGETNLGLDPPGKEVGSVSLWLMNKRGN